MSAQPTPGPWTFDPATGTVSTPDAKTLCYVSTIGARSDAFEVAKANGRVLAAAPELLAALQKFVQWHGKRAIEAHDQLLPAAEQDPEVAEAMALIARVTGAPL